MRTDRRVQLVQLGLACVVVGYGVGFLLEAALGSDGYSMLISGISLSTKVPFWLVNIVVGVLFVLMAWARGVIPGVGTLVQPVVVGVSVSVAMAQIPEPHGLPLRSAELALALVLLTLGVAGYLASNTGAGPTEAAAIAWDPPVRFRWSYSAVQLIGAVLGWFLGAAFGVGTIVVILLLGPAVDLVRRLAPGLERDPFPGQAR